MPEFFLNLFRARDCVGDFFPQQLAVALPHPLHGGFDGGLRHPEFVAELRIRPPARLARLIVLQQLEQRGLATRRVFLAQPIQRLLQDGLRPPTLKDLVRRQFIHRFEEITILTSRLVQRNEDAATAALLRPILPALPPALRCRSSRPIAKVTSFCAWLSEARWSRRTNQR